MSDPSGRRGPHGPEHPGLARSNIMPLKSDTEVKVLTYNRGFLPKGEPSRVVRIYHATGNPPRTG